MLQKSGATSDKTVQISTSILVARVHPLEWLLPKAEVEMGTAVELGLVASLVSEQASIVPK